MDQIYREEMRPRARTGSTATSVAAAIEATPKAPAMIERIWERFGEGSFTPEEMTARLERDYPDERFLLTTVRARVCALHKAGRIKDCGERGLGESNKSKVIRWRRTTVEEYAAHVARQEALEGAE